MTSTASSPTLVLSEPDPLLALPHACWNHRHYQQAELRLNNQIKALQRRLDRNDLGTHGVNVGPSLDEEEGHYRSVAQTEGAPLLVQHLDEHRRALAKERKRWEKTIATLAVNSALWPSFASGVRGIGPLSFGQLLAELGDIRRFDGPAKIWKRMGLAVIEGRAQRKSRNKVEAELQGYSPRRARLSYLIGANLIRQNNNGYRSLYDERKGYEEEQHPELTKMHRHKRAQRYMVKRLYLDLWRSARA